MRRFHRWILSSAVVLGASQCANAQQQASSFMTGVKAQNIQNVPLDTSKAIAQHPGQSTRFANRFDFSQLFRKKPESLFQPKHGISPLPPPSSFPSTKYQNFKMVGQPPFLLNWMFGNSNNTSPIQPVAPFIPGQKAPVGPGSG